MASFLAVAWLTVMVAAISASYDGWLKLNAPHSVSQESADETGDASHENDEESKGESNDDIAISRDHKRLHLLMRTTKSFLGPLCDLQAFTGMAIVIAGFSQWETISFYHESLVTAYWWLTLNSFWVARVNYMDIDTKVEGKKVFVRRLSVLISCILGITFQCMAIKREEHHWNYHEDEHCYRWRDDTSTWPWIAGTLLYTFTLFLIMVPQTRSCIRDCATWADRKIKDLKKNMVKKYTAFRSSSRPPATATTHPSYPSIMRVKKFAILALATLAFSVSWSLAQFLSIWSYGDGYTPLFILAYTGFNIQSTFDVITLKTLNNNIIDGDELKMGFGQVLPLVLIMQLSFMFIDLWEGKPDQNSMRESSELT
jgi:hypothetical protein